MFFQAKYLIFKCIAFMRDFLKGLSNKRSLPIMNLNYDYFASNQKKVLICYDDSLFYSPTKNWGGNTRNQECSIILNYFYDKRYLVDFVDVNKHTLESCKTNLDVQYNIIFGFGEVFHKFCEMNKPAKKIIYLTEKPPHFSLEKEKERLDYFYERHGIRVPSKRSGLFYKDYHFDNKDAIVYIGHEKDKKYFSFNIPLFSQSVTGIQNKSFDISVKLNKTIVTNFLWLGSFGAIHKGLDLLLDVFKKFPNCNLYVAGLRRMERIELSSLIKNSKNIVDLGFINIQSVQFLEIANKCAFVFLPSCSESIPTSVITAMNHGLIPVVTKNCGIYDLDFGILMDDYKVEYIEGIIENIISWDKEKIAVDTMKSINYANEYYSLEKYKQNFECNMNLITK